MQSSTIPLQLWLANSHASKFHDLARAWNEPDKYGLLTKLVEDSRLRAIEKELAEGLSKIYKDKYTPMIETPTERETGARTRGPPPPPPTLRGLTIEQLLADPECYNELLGPQRDVTSRRTSHVARAILRMILSLEYLCLNVVRSSSVPY